MEDLNEIKNDIGDGNICPIFSVSAFTGTGIDVVRSFMGLLPRSTKRTENIPALI